MIFTKQQQHQIVTCIYPKALRHRRVPALPFSLQSAALTSGFPNGFFQQPGLEMSQKARGPSFANDGIPLHFNIYQAFRSILLFKLWESHGIPWESQILRHTSCVVCFFCCVFPSRRLVLQTSNVPVDVVKPRVLQYRHQMFQQETANK